MIPARPSPSQGLLPSGRTARTAPVHGSTDGNKLCISSRRPENSRPHLKAFRPAAERPEQRQPTVSPTATSCASALAGQKIVARTSGPSAQREKGSSSEHGSTQSNKLRVSSRRAESRSHFKVTISQYERARHYAQQRNVRAARLNVSTFGNKPRIKSRRPAESRPHFRTLCPAKEKLGQRKSTAPPSAISRASTFTNKRRESSALQALRREERAPGSENPQFRPTASPLGNKPRNSFHMQAERTVRT